MYLTRNQVLGQSHRGGAPSFADFTQLVTGVLPTINDATDDLRCDLDYMPNDGHERLYDYVLLSGVGFGGNSCARVMKRT